MALGCTKPNDNPGGSGGAGGETPKPGALSCNSPVDDASKNLRTSLQYHERAPDQTKNCVNCAQYTEGQYGDCGGCKLIPGPVKPKGGCTSFAPKEGGAAPT